MKGSRQEILKHDWQIFKARYMLAGEFKKIEDEFMALCEVECFEALSVYSATVNSRFSAKIEKMIASYPDKNPHEVLQQRMFGRATAEDYHKALIKQNFKNLSTRQYFREQNKLLKNFSSTLRVFDLDEKTFMEEYYSIPYINDIYSEIVETGKVI